MKNLALLVLVFSFILFSSTVFAAPNYAGVGFSLVDYEDDLGFDAEVSALSGKFGTYFNENFALEGRIGFGLDEDTVAVINGFDVDFELDNYVGVYIRGEIPSNQIKPYFMLGFTRAEGTVSAAGFSESDDESDLSYGIGIDFMLSENNSLGLEYMQLLDKSDFEVNAITFGTTFYF